MITGCRGNTRLSCIGQIDVDEQEQSRDCEMGMDSDTDTLTTESEDDSVQTQLSGLMFRLDVELFVKIRHCPRTFATSSFTLAFDTVGTMHYSINAADGLLQCASLQCDQGHMLEQIKTKAHALVLNAIGFQAAESVRWTKTLLSDLWEGRLPRDEDSLSDDMSVLTSPSCFSAVSHGISSVDSCSLADPEVCTRQWKRSRRPLSRCLVPKNITTTNDEKEKDGKRGWQHSIFYQLVAFSFLFAMSFQFMKMKDFCHSLLQLNFNVNIQRANNALLLRIPKVQTLLSSPKGVSFHRVITDFPENSEFLLSFETQETSCQANDIYGANDCHFDWNDDVVGNFSTAIPQMLDETSSLHADLVLEGHIPYKIDCALCGEPCKLEVPLIHFEYSLQMPDCPVDLSVHAQDFDFQLWKHSPTEGILSVSLEGNAVVYSAPGQKLAEFQVSGAIR